ncbi:MAG: hypothetical protein ABWX68_08270 [Arthrobacter sp.]|uniref:hypothetical protein n=1 Tax=Arthrobacter sp. TaxID=1667 RepID=UPI003488B232
MGKTTSRAANGGLIHIDKGSLQERALLKVAPFTPPWLVGAGLYPAAAVTHHLWSAPAVLPWMTIGMNIATAALTALTWKVSRQRKIQGRLHSTVTTAYAGVWMTAATITGPTAQWTTNLGALGLVTLAAGWNIRQVIRTEEGDGDTAQGGFKAIFGTAADQVGLKGTVLKKVDVVSPAKAIGAVEMSDGNTADDLQRRLPAIESLLGLPPGSLNSVQDLDAANLAKLVVSNPGILRQPVPYPGPSRPGSSIAEPFRVGLGQDGEDAEMQVVNALTQVMGRSGSAKSFGAFWNFAGELMTRFDAALFVIDLDKGEQTIGPMRRGLHRVALTPANAAELLTQFRAAIKPRTDYLGEHGYREWEEGCGLTFLVLWVEEAASLFENVDEEEMKKFSRACRSAGIHLVSSLQRADHTQSPTFIRGQLSKWCFGVENSHDASFGLSERQQAAGCAPEMWGDTQPGMSYLDGKGNAPERIAIPNRAYMWTVQQMVDHAAAYPATGRPLDTVTAKYLKAGPGGWADPNAAPSTASSAPANEDQDHEPMDDFTAVTSEYAQTPDENPDLQADIDTPIDPAPGEWDLAGDKMPSAQALVVLRAAIERYRGKEFAPRDLGDVLTRTGYSRGWIMSHLKAMVAAGELRHDEANGRYHVRELQPA